MVATLADLQVNNLTHDNSLLEKRVWWPLDAQGRVVERQIQTDLWYLYANSNTHTWLLNAHYANTEQYVLDRNALNVGST